MVQTARRTRMSTRVPEGSCQSTTLRNHHLPYCARIWTGRYLEEGSVLGPLSRTETGLGAGEYDTLSRVLYYLRKGRGRVGQRKAWERRKIYLESHRLPLPCLWTHQGSSGKFTGSYKGAIDSLPQPFYASGSDSLFPLSLEALYSSEHNIAVYLKPT